MMGMCIRWEESLHYVHQIITVCTSDILNCLLHLTLKTVLNNLVLTS